MADENENELELDDGGGKKKKMIIIIAAVVLLAGGAGAFFLMGGEEPTPEQVEGALTAGEEGAEGTEGADATAATAASSGAEIGNAIYVPMPRAFRFNVPGASRDRFVEIKAQLLVRSADDEETAKKHIPLIESTLLGVFSQANADDLATSAGKIALRQKVLVEVQKVLMEIEENKLVEEVLFTGFVMQ